MSGTLVAGIIMGAIQLGTAIAQGIGGGRRRRAARDQAVSYAKEDIANIEEQRTFDTEQFNILKKQNDRQQAIDTRAFMADKKDVYREKNKAVDALSAKRSNDRADRIMGLQENNSFDPLTQNDPRNGRF